LEALQVETQSRSAHRGQIGLTCAFQEALTMVGTRMDPPICTLTFSKSSVMSRTPAASTESLSDYQLRTTTRRTDHPDFESVKRNDQALFHLVDTPPKQDERFFQRAIGFVVAVHGREAEVRAVAVRSVRDVSSSAQVVEPVEVRVLRRGVVTRQQQVDLVRMP
jgi:hypothetical protein